MGASYIATAAAAVHVNTLGVVAVSALIYVRACACPVDLSYNVFSSSYL